MAEKNNGRKKKKVPTIKRFPNKRISSLSEPFINDQGIFDVRLLTKGMVMEEIEKFFPPLPLSVAKAKKRGGPVPTFNMRELIRSIIVEEFEQVGKNRETGNVRHFFYTNIIYTLTRICKVTNMNSLYSTLNDAWGDVVKAGLVTYEGMNIVGGKDVWFRSFAEHSPFYNLILCVEKQSLLESLTWTAKLFRTSIVTAGGQPSRSAIYAFVRNLVKWGLKLDAPFRLLVITDLDPAGKYIEGTFKKHFEDAVEAYGGEGKVLPPIRLFLRLDQISDRLLDGFAVPAKDKGAETKQAIKASQTKLKWFKKILGDNWKRLQIDDTMMKVELDAVKPYQMERRIIQEFLQIIDDTSLIMVTEIMDSFEKEREKSINVLFNAYREEKIEPLVEEYLKPIDDAKTKFRNQKQETEYQARLTYLQFEDEVKEFRRNMERGAKKQWEQNIEKHREYADSMVSDELWELDELERTIQMIHERQEHLRERIEENTGLFRREIEESEEILGEMYEKLKKNRSLLLDPAIKSRDEVIEEADNNWERKKEVLDQFASQKRGGFGPHIHSIEKQFFDSLNSVQVPMYFTEVESDSGVQKEMAYLINRPEMLLNEGQSCLAHPKPAFREVDCLEKSVSDSHFDETKKDPSLSKFRNAFTRSFEDALYDLAMKKLEQVEVQLTSAVDKPEGYKEELFTLVKELEEDKEEQIADDEK